MMSLTDLRCEVDSRRAELLRQRAAGRKITGIDYIVVNPGQTSLEVFFIDAEPPAELVTGGVELCEITGGRRVVVKVVDVGTTAGTPSSLHLILSGFGDFSDYLLEIKQPPTGTTILDELYRRCAFNFKVECPARFDCRPPTTDHEARPETIDVDYLAKDYASFRQALVDLIPRLSPQWTERLAADLGITVLELLAYGADQLSYYQDAVANEAYLETARQRLSVRRHARLIDYDMHDGASARAFVHFTVTDGSSLEIDEDHPLELATHIETLIGPSAPGVVIQVRDEDATDEPTVTDRGRVVVLTDAVFRTFTAARLHHRLNTIALHDWGQDSCSLAVGATSVDLVGDLGGVLVAGQLLLLEEVKDPRTGDDTLFDPAHRQVVRLTAVDFVRDNLTNTDVTRVRWDGADALRFRLCVTCDGGPGISVARGNLVLADHGLAVAESGRQANAIASGDGAARFLLAHGPLSFRPALPDAGAGAALLATVDPHGAAAQVQLWIDGQEWRPVPTLIGSDRFDSHFAVETANDGRALLRFGDSQMGMAPAGDAVFDVRYRVGIGPEGNVGAEAIAHVLEDREMRGTLVDVIEGVRNPLPAWGGLEPENTEAVRRIAPAAFRAIQYRAVTEADYAEIAERHPSVRRAVARFRWTGSWHTVFISIDPAGRVDLRNEQADQIAAHVARFTQAGYDLEIVPPHYVPLAIDLEICVGRAHFRPDIEQAVKAALSSGTQTNGRPGFFHPDNFTFGQSLYLSRLSAAVAQVEGVESVLATRFARVSDKEAATGGSFTAANLARGEIVIGPLEIVRLDDDADFPENGVLRLSMQGGK